MRDVSAPTYAIGSSIQDWHALGVAAYQSASDAHGEHVPHVSIAWQFVKDNPELFGDCEAWPKSFPGEAPRWFRMGYKGLA